MLSFIKFTPDSSYKHKIPVRIAFTLLIIAVSITIPTSSIFAVKYTNLSPFDSESLPLSSGNGLIVSYSFDGNTNDDSGYGNNGTSNGASYTDGLSGQALRLDGIDDYVRMPLDINPDVMPQATITAWVKTDKAEGTVISHDNGGYDRTIDIDSRGGGLGWSAFSGSGAVLGFHPIVTGDWVFLAAVYDQTTATVRLHVNDSIYEEAGSLGNGLDYVHIGSNPSFGSFFSGVIDEVRIYNSALSVQEISGIYSELSSAAATANSGQSASTEPGMAAYYPFDSDLRDYSNNSNHGNAIGNITFTPGAVDNGVKFDGGSYVEVPDSPSLDLYNAFTISVWLNKEDSGTGGWSIVLSKGDTSSLGDDSPYALAHSSDGLSPLIRLVQDNRYTSITSGARADFRQWYHLTVTWDGQNIKFYIDGTVKDTKTWTGTLPDSSASLLIGCDPPGSTEYYKGDMDELRIYNYVLTPGEITTLYNQGTPVIPDAEPTEPEPTEPEPTTTEPPVVTPPQATLTFESAEGRTGDTIQVPLSLSEVQALIGNMDVELSYDSSVLRATKVNKGSLLSGATFDSNIMTGTIRIALFVSNGISGAGSIAVIEFEVIGSEGESTALAIDDILANKASDTSPMTVQANNGLFTIISALKGDCDGDGSITVNDALWILQAAVGKREVTAGMDINGDGTISSVDARMVLRAALGLEVVR